MHKLGVLREAIQHFEDLLMALCWLDWEEAGSVG